MDKKDSIKNDEDVKTYNEISLYVIENCDRCKGLKTKLSEKNIEFNLLEITADNISTFISEGFKLAPILVIDGEMLGYEDALKWVSEF